MLLCETRIIKGQNYRKETWGQGERREKNSLLHASFTRNKTHEEGSSSARAPSKDSTGDGAPSAGSTGEEPSE